MGFPCHFTVLHLHVVVGAHGKILALFPAPGCIGISQGRGQCFVKEHFASWKLVRRSPGPEELELRLRTSHHLGVALETLD